MTLRTEKEIRMKDGSIVRAGARVIPHPDKATRCLVYGARLEPYCCRWTSAFHRPELEELERQSNDGVVSSISGENVEPDGVDCHGYPSWILALGLI